MKLVNTLGLAGLSAALLLGAAPAIASEKCDDGLAAATNSYVEDVLEVEQYCEQIKLRGGRCTTIQTRETKAAVLEAMIRRDCTTADLSDFRPGTCGGNAGGNLTTFIDCVKRSANTWINYMVAASFGLPVPPVPTPAGSPIVTPTPTPSGPTPTPTRTPGKTPGPGQTKTCQPSLGGECLSDLFQGCCNTGYKCLFNSSSVGVCSVPVVPTPTPTAVPPPTPVGCGNNIKEGTEVCDGTDLGGVTCEQQNFPGGGTLICNPTCLDFDVWLPRQHVEGIPDAYRELAPVGSFPTDRPLPQPRTTRLRQGRAFLLSSLLLPLLIGARAPMGPGASVAPLATGDLPSRCATTKLAGVAAEARLAITCGSRAAARQIPVEQACLDRAQALGERVFVRAESSGGCAVNGDFTAAGARVDLLRSDIAGAISAGATTASQRCAALKLRAAGRAARLRLRCFAGATGLGLAAPSECLTNASDSIEAAFTSAEANAEAAGGCATSGDAGAIAALVATAADDLARLLSPRSVASCGNGSAESGEECDDGNTASGDGCSATCALESTAARCAGVATTTGVALGAELVSDQLASPVHLTSPPLDTRRLFVVEQEGVIRIIADGALLPTPFLDIQPLVSCCGERGLLSVAFHPDYETNGRFFIDYTNTAGNTVIARYDTDPGNPDLADPSSARILLTIDQPFPNHNGGQLAFGPDGYMYVGMGDGGGGGDPRNNAQNDNMLLGKLLRVDVDVEGPLYYAIPPTNPHVSSGTNPIELIWAKGLRNPWRFSFDRATGDLLIGDVGQDLWEEIDFQPASSQGGENYGWDVFEGSHCFDPAPAPACPNPATGLVMPILEFDHASGACSVTGGFVYRGCAMPDLRGTYFYSDYCVGFVRTFRVNSGNPTGHADVTSALSADVGPLGSIVSFGEDARGEIYGVDLGGKIFRIVPGS